MDTAIDWFKGVTVIAILGLIILNPDPFRRVIDAVLGTLRDTMQLGGG